MEITGKIKMIGLTQDVSPTFRKREVVITTEEQYPQHILIDFTQDKTDLLNGFQIGEPVRVSINLRGREWVNPQGETKYFNTIQGWRIDRMQNQPTDAYGQQGYATQGGYGQPQQGYTNTGYHGNGSATNVYFNNQQNPSQNSNAGILPPPPYDGPDDLPF